MWQPNKAQWRIIWLVALLVILAWPPDQGRSLGMKLVNWLVDPSGKLPTLPPPLPISLEDNADAVTAHDDQAYEYYRAWESSSTMRTRLKLKSAGDPLESTTQRQILVGIVILTALAIWRLDARPKKMGS